MASCKYCGKEISWLKEKNKFTPIESDGSVHECTEFKNARKSSKKISRSEISPDLLKQYEDNMNKTKK